MKHRATWTLPLLAGMLVTACGGSSSSSATSSAGAGSSGGVPSDASGSLAGGSFCDKARSYSKVALDEAQQLFSGGAGAQSNPQDLARKFGDLIKKEAPLSQDLANSAPDEIKADVEYLARINEKLVQSVNDANGDFTKIESQFAPLSQDPKFTSTTQKLEKYLADKCGIKPAAPSFSAPSEPGQPGATPP